MSVYTSTQRTTDHGSRFGVKPTRVVLHHAATTSLAGLLRLMMPGGRKVSAHAAIHENEIVSVVPESRRSFSLASAIFERGVLSAECVNSTGAPSWSLSDRTHESIARWVADVCRRHGIRPHRDGDPNTWTVIGHREVFTIHRRGYATACPGGMRLDSITRRAQQILNPPLPEPEDEEMKPTNYADKATLTGGKFTAGTKCMTVWPSGAIQEYVIGGGSRPVELSLLMFDLFGGHVALEPVAYASIRDAYRALQGGGGVVTTDVSGLQASIDLVREDVNRTRTIS